MRIDKMSFKKAREELVKQIEKRFSEIKALEKDFEDKFIFLGRDDETFSDILPFTVAGVDGGVAKESLVCLDLFLLRPAGVVLKYEWDEEKKKVKCKKVKCYNKYGNDIRFESLGKENDEISSILKFTCKRVLAEFELAEKICSSDKPDLVLLHGPLFPHYLKDSIKSQGNKSEDFEELGKIIANLLDFQFSTDSFVCGVVEDTRGRTFVKSVINSERFSDVEILSAIMPKDAITVPVKHEGMDQLKKISKDFGKIENLSVFYYRPYSEDVPLRIEFVPKKDPVKESLKIANMLKVQMFPLRTYAMPWALVEADKLAKISEEESKVLFGHLLCVVNEMLLLRRKKRII